MKKLLLITSLLVAAHCGTGQIKVGPEAGLNMSNYSFSNTRRSFSSAPVTGLRLGFVADLAIAGNKCYLQPGVMYVGNGTAVNESGYTITHGSRTYRVNTIEVPFNFLYKFSRPGKSRLFAGAGLYLGMNLNTSAFYITNYDMGMGVNAGCEFKQGLFIRAIAQKGVVKPKSSDVSVGSSNIGFTLGYFFNHNRTGRASGRLPADIFQ